MITHVDSRDEGVGSGLEGLRKRQVEVAQGTGRKCDGFALQ